MNDLGTSLEGEGTSKEPANETAQSIRDAAGNSIAHIYDVSSLEYTESLVDDKVEAYDRINGVVNFAGITRDTICTKMDGRAVGQRH